jgi:acetylornithine deacetylase
MPSIDRGYLNTTLADLVRINSINPAFSGGTSDERAIASYVGNAMTALGIEVRTLAADPARPSVVGRLRGSGAGSSLLLYAHVDTVGVEGMPEPFSAEIREGRMYGRGAYDMKGGMAACLAAVKAIVDAKVALAGDVLITGVADEEVASIGMSEVLRHVRADAAIVTEATELALCVAHKGFSWIEVKTLGRAAHGSRFNEGIDANMRMGRFLAQLDLLERELRARDPHPLCGPPSLHAGVLQGGTGTSTYAAESRVEIERRMAPGETETGVVAEIQAIVDRLTAADPSFSAAVRPFLTRPAFETDASSKLVQVVRDSAASVLGTPPDIIGVPYWMDASLLSEAGIPTVVIGPIGTGAHAAVEWVDLDSVASVAEILAKSAVALCSG